MNIRQLKNIMKEVNEPNEYFLEPHDLQHPLYWIYKVDNVRVKTIFPKLEGLRKPDARFDVFIMDYLYLKGIIYSKMKVIFFMLDLREVIFLNLIDLEIYIHWKKLMKLK